MNVNFNSLIVLSIILLICIIATVWIIMHYRYKIVESNNKSKKELLQINTDHQKEMKDMEYKHKKEIEELKLK